MSESLPTTICDAGPLIHLDELDCLSLLNVQTLVQSLSLDIGEQAALSLLEQHPQAMFLTDDAAARLAATTIGYRVHGTIGILIRAIRRHLPRSCMLCKIW